MEQTTITVVIDGTPYRLNTSDQESIRKLSSSDRLQLISLLEAVKQLDPGQSTAVVETTDRGVNIDELPSLTASESNSLNLHNSQPSLTPERLGSGDTDALFAKLVMQEEMNKKKPLTPRSLYKFIAGVAVVVVVLIVIL